MLHIFLFPTYKIYFDNFIFVNSLFCFGPDWCAGEHDRWAPLHELYLGGLEGCTHLMCCHHASSVGGCGDYKTNTVIN